MDNTNNNITNIIPVNIESEMKKSFIEYAMSVIADRALPDVRDGLKPVHRRILYAMHVLGYTPEKAYRKCATTVGEVMGKFHPHGDAAIYDSLVRLAQDFSLRAPLIDGHGNFGSRDGDSPAAMRYTEARLAKIAAEMLSEINKDTVDFKPNYDEHEMEPVVLPSRLPNLLVNGSSGIAVGMATNIPPHNLGEVVDGIIKVIDNPEITIEELIEVIKGPDFPTGGMIIGKRGIYDAYKTGKGRIVVRAHAEIEEENGNKHRIIVHDLPYQVNKARLIEKIAELVKEKRISGISDINDESDRNEAVRIVITLKRDANPNVILNQLYKNTQLQDSFNVNMLALTPTKYGTFEPKILNLKQAINYYIIHQVEVIERRTRFELEKAEARAHILEGYRIAIANLDEIIEIIKTSRTEADAKGRMIEKFLLSEKQAQAIVDMRLGRLTGLEVEKLEEEYNSVLEKVKYYKEILLDRELVYSIIKDEITVIKNKYADERRSELVIDEMEFDIEDLIQEKEIVLTLTHFGYIKRIPCDTYKSQRRGGKGITGLSTKEEDFVETILTTSTHHIILFFTSRGRVFKLKGFQIPEAGRQAKGTAIVNLLQLDSDEKVTTVIPIREFDQEKYLFLATKNGNVKKSKLADYVNIRKGGLNAVVLRDEDELIDVRLTNGNQDIFIVTRKGMSIRFNEKDVRSMGRVSQGVRGIRLQKGDYVIGMSEYIEGTKLLCVTENGFGKRTELFEYKVQTRGGKGIYTYRITQKTGEICGMKLVNDDDDLIMISSDGIVIRIAVNEISILGRATQGVKVMRTKDENKVVSIAKIIPDDEDDEDDENNDNSKQKENLDEEEQAGEKEE